MTVQDSALERRVLGVEPRAQVCWPSQCIGPRQHSCVRGTRCSLCSPVVEGLVGKTGKAVALRDSPLLTYCVLGQKYLICEIGVTITTYLGGFSGVF